MCSGEGGHVLPLSSRELGEPGEPGELWVQKQATPSRSGEEEEEGCCRLNVTEGVEKILCRIEKHAEAEIAVIGKTGAIGETGGIGETGAHVGTGGIGGAGGTPRWTYSKYTAK